jgi:hypothetical protein
VHVAGAGGVACADVAVPNKVSAYESDEDGEDGASGEVRKHQIERIRLSVSGKGTSRDTMV